MAMAPASPTATGTGCIPPTPLLRGGIAFVAILGVIIVNLRDVRHQHRDRRRRGRPVHLHLRARLRRASSCSRSSAGSSSASACSGSPGACTPSASRTSWSRCAAGCCSAPIVRAGWTASRASTSCGRSSPGWSVPRSSRSTSPGRTRTCRSAYLGSAQADALRRGDPAPRLRHTGRHHRRSHAAPALPRASSSAVRRRAARS